MTVNNAGVVERVPCPGRKIWEFAVNSNKVIVKHYGEHTCTSKEVMPFTAEEEFRKRPSTRPCELRRDILGDMIRSGATMNDVEDKANEYLDRKKISKAKRKVLGNSDFQRLAELKEKYKKDDKFLIYSFNTKESNGDDTYVFKSSKTCLNIIRNIDRKGSHFLRDSPVYFDAKENRVREKTTYTLSVFHPMLRKMIPLATMDCDGENFESCVKFFQNLNNALGELFLVDGIFDPCVTVLDEKACNWLALQSVYGEEFMSRVVS